MLIEPGSRISLVHVAGPPLHHEQMRPDLCELTSDNDAVLVQADDRIPDGSRGKRILREGDAAQQIVDVARRTKPDLLVVGTHGRGLVGRMLLGSTAVHVLRHAPCPVLVVSRRKRDTTSQPAAIRRVLMAINDDNGLSAAAVGVAAKIAAAHGATMKLIHVVPHLTRYEPDAVGGDDWLQAHLLERGQAFLDSFQLNSATLEPVERVLREGDVTSQIQSVANEWNADLIVVGNHERHGFGGFIAPRHTDSVACRAARPVLCVTPDKRK